MAYGVKYQFSIEATNGDEVDIFLLQRDYSGQKHIRALGRAPILKRERNGCILGTSLEIFAECRVDGEFAELYTSDAYEYKVEVYKRQMLQWTGFVSPELYAEPDIAPPYDVQIIATDGLGELKNYDFAAYDRPKSYQAYIESMLEHTGLALAVEVVSDLQYYDEGWSDANGLESIVVDLSHKAGENCYDVLQAMLTSVNACITQQDGSWTVIRESDLYSWRDTIGSMEFGSMNSCDWWPVGNLNADVIPAKKYLSLTSENHYKPTVLQNSAMASDEGWAKEYNAAYDETEKAYILPDGGSNIRQTANFFTEVGYRLFLHISARNVGDAAESQKLGVMIKINGRMYQAGDEFWLKELAGYEGRYAWSNTEGYLEFELPEPSDSETRADASDIEVVIPLYKYDSRSYAYATSLEVMIFNISGVHDIYLYECSLQQYEQPLGHKIEAVIANGARESVSDIELALNDGTYAQPAAEIFRNAIPIAYHSEAIIQKWKTPAAGEGSYLLVMAKDYAMQVALPRMRYRGKLNVPSMAEPVVPLLFFRDGTYYFLNTYSYDLLNDELEVELISIPSAVVSIESEKISEIALPGTASGTGTGGSGVAGGGTSITIDTEMSDTSTNPVQNRVIKAYVDTKIAPFEDMFYFADDNTIGTKYSFFSEQENSAGGVGEAIGTSGGGGDIDLTGYATEEWVQSQGYAKATDIPSKVSELENDAQYVSKSQADGTYVIWTDEFVPLKEKVDSIDDRVTVLEATGGTGSGEIDLTAYATKTWVEEQVGGKQDTIEDLAAIREGASKGATAAQPADIPTKVSQLTNDRNYITTTAADGKYAAYSDLAAYLKSTDIADWAKAATKPSYDYSEIGNTPNLSVYALASALNDYALKNDVYTQQQIAEILKSYVLTDDIAELVEWYESIGVKFIKDADGAIKMDGDFYTTGENSAGGVGENVGTSGGGGLDESQLEDYLTENGYATQSWVTSQGYASSSSVDAKQDKITDLAAIREGAALGATALQSVPDGYVTETELDQKGYATTADLSGKVDKVTGKGLSTNDYTTEDKNKLASLENYDDTEVKNGITANAEAIAEVSNRVIPLEEWYDLVGQHFKYDETNEAWYLDGDFYATGENSAGGAGDELIDIAGLDTRVETLETKVEELQKTSGQNLAIDFQGFDDLIQLSGSITPAELAAVGLTAGAIENMLNGQYNKIVHSGAKRQVWNYTAYEGDGIISIYLMQGDGFDIFSGYHLSYSSTTGYWSIAFGEI